MAFLSEVSLQKERFSLLLLEPGEIYFEDFSVFFYPSDLPEEEAIRRRTRGRLKVCSKSIVFDPQDVSQPVVKFPLRECIQIDKWTGPLLSRLGNRGDVIVIQCKQKIEMKANNIIGSYEFKKETTKHLFSLNYVTPDDVLQMMCQLHRASTLPLADEAGMIAAIVYSCYNRTKFNTSWLETLYEQIVMETVGDHITPLVVNPGRIMLTSSRLYFQPFNNVESVPVIKIKLSDIKRLTKRRFLLREVGLEIFCTEGSFKSDMFLAFSKPEDRNKLYKNILAQEGVSLKESAQENMTLLWQNGVISNFDYLLYLNSQADRSFNDLTQYPVFPWVIADYISEELDLTNPETFRDLSKPIGALNPQRLERFKERKVDMPEPKFLYGSHYSTPGYVLYYLLRVAPEYALCLQNGRFDQPDRLFKSVAETWSNVLSLPSDVKELIPEFYQPEMADFLINRSGLNLGVQQDGSKVNRVELPPWADDEVDFCRKCRKALESDHVSNHLHHWIDLIFGYKQRGPEADEADNVFYYLTYEGAVDLDSIKDPNEQASVKVQIMEFGQTPKQLFTKPHPSRFSPAVPVSRHSNNSSPVPVPQPVEEESANERLRSDSDAFTDTHTDTQDLEEDTASAIQRKGSLLSHQWDRMDQLQPACQHKLHKDTVKDVQVSDDGKTVFSVSQDTSLKLYSLEDQRQRRSISISSMPLSSLSAMPDGKTVLVGSWDDSLYLYSIEYGRIVDKLMAHDDAVSALHLQGEVLVTASWDSTVKVWTVEDLCGQSNGTVRLNSVQMTAEFDHETGVSCLDVNGDNSLVLSGTKDGAVYIWDVGSQSVLRSSMSHTGMVHDVKFSPDGKMILSAGEDRFMRVVDVGTGTEVFAKETEHEIRCVCWRENTVLAGSSSGELLVWDMVKAQLTATIPGHDDAISCIQATSDGHTVVTGGTDKKVIVWKVR
ncbi:protein FAN-like isoform X1 [Patiria miniata]|uniref:Protein FAN n=1 Tax=Patiria miniata TaxID=46514 RepID=A0A914AX85_PATMI|nr:protein FAN-like isoform X1 [Patiria miniata]